MPTFRSITINLVSQFDILTIPEYFPLTPAPSPSPSDPFTAKPVTSTNDQNCYEIKYDNHVYLTDSLYSHSSPNPEAVVYIPLYPHSQFWLNYSIAPPQPPGSLFYFKLFIDGRHAVSWGVGEEEKFQGKTMFGLFTSGDVWTSMGGGVTLGAEKRGLWFGGLEDEESSSSEQKENAEKRELEVRVYRCKGRKRVAKDLDVFRGYDGENGGVRYVSTFLLRLNL